MSAYFPRSAASDPEIFTAGVVELLAGYPEWVLVEMVSVRTGLPARHTFMPSIAEIREFCARAVEERRRHDELLARRAPRLPPPPDRSDRPTYAELVARAAAHGVFIGDGRDPRDASVAERPPRARRGGEAPHETRFCGDPGEAVAIGEVMQRLRIGKAQWDAIPNRQPEVGGGRPEVGNPSSDPDCRFPISDS